MNIDQTNIRIRDFYKKNPHIDFETINLLIIDLFERVLDNPQNKGELPHLKILNDLEGMFQKYNSSTVKSTAQTSVEKLNQSSTGNNEFKTIINKMFPTSEINNPDRDLFLMKRLMKPLILFENKEHDGNITIEEVNSFIDKTGSSNANGLFISQNSGISSKPNYHIDYVKGNILVYIHNAEYSSDRIKIGIDIIDTLSEKLKELTKSSSSVFETNIPKDVLDEVNREYQLFLSQKEAVITVFKESQRKVLSQIDEIRFPALDRYLSSKYVNNIRKVGFKCELCKLFNANNLKALAAHKRGCNRKNIFIPATQEIALVV
jgi:hypothetical protein